VWKELPRLVLHTTHVWLQSGDVSCRHNLSTVYVYVCKGVRGNTVGLQLVTQ
jgi:hypothetical protein